MFSDPATLGGWRVRSTPHTQHEPFISGIATRHSVTELILFATSASFDSRVSGKFLTLCGGSDTGRLVFAMWAGMTVVSIGVLAALDVELREAKLKVIISLKRWMAYCREFLGQEKPLIHI